MDYLQPIELYNNPWHDLSFSIKTSLKWNEFTLMWILLLLKKSMEFASTGVVSYTTDMESASCDIDPIHLH